MAKGYEGKSEIYRDDLERCELLKKIIPPVCYGLAVLFILLSGVRIVDSTEIGVVRRFGELKSTIDGGINLVNPFTDTVTKYDLKVQATETSFASYTKDAQPLVSSIEYQYSIDGAYALDIAREYGTQEMLQSKLGNIIEERVKVVFSRYSAMNLLESRSTLSPEVLAEMKDLSNMFHIRVTSVIVKDIDFSEAFEASVEAKMEAEQEALKAEQEKKKAVIQAEQAEEVATIEARAQVAAAQGEAEALKIKRDALSQMPDTYIQQLYLETWNGVLPQIITNGSGLMIAPDLKE
jgi:regulator of protease activity HflC (stomatin/prohibitin superfamily)